MPANSASAGRVAAGAAAPSNGIGDVATALTDGEEGAEPEMEEMEAMVVGTSGKVAEDVG